jgi:hypothetical protein
MAWQYLLEHEHWEKDKDNRGPAQGNDEDAADFDYQRDYAAIPIPLKGLPIIAGTLGYPQSKN